MNALPSLTRGDLAELTWRALLCCPDIEDDEAVVNHLHRHGLTICQIDQPLAEQIDEARAVRREK